MASVTTPSSAWLPPALAIIRAFEGCKLTAYPDPITRSAPWTIGWGTTVYFDGQPVKRGDVISQGLADDLLSWRVEEMGRTLTRALPGWAALNANQQAALVSFSYDVGPAWFGASGFDTISRRMRDGELSRVPEALLLYVNPGSAVEAGLRRRREAEGSLWSTPPTGAAAAPAPVTTATTPPVWPPGMVGPKKRPSLMPGDHHLIVNDINETATAWAHDGIRLWQIPCLARGQGREAEWDRTGTDTPPGLYRVGKVFRDYEEDPTARFTPDRRAYGWYSFDLEGLEGQEGPSSRPYRDGIMIHGGGSACGWPGAWSPRQPLHPTLGCIRLHNQDLRDRILPLLGLGTVWVSVLQEAA